MGKSSQIVFQKFAASIETFLERISSIIRLGYVQKAYLWLNEH